MAESRQRSSSIMFRALRIMGTITVIKFVPFCMVRSGWFGLRVGDKEMSCLYTTIGSARWLMTSSINNTGILPINWRVLDHLTKMRRLGGAEMMSPRQVCLDRSNFADEVGARLLCLCMAKNLNIRHAHMEVP